MEPTLTDTLCTRCGLCCDGTLFADVELATRAEAASLELMGLDIEDEPGAGLLSQPCAALRGRRCGIYTHRPKCCRTFECRLLQDARRGAVSVEFAIGRIEDALGTVRRVRSLLRRLGERSEDLPLAERCADAMAAPARANPAEHAMRAELRAGMAALKTSIRRTFLRGSRG